MAPVWFIAILLAGCGSRQVDSSAEKRLPVFAGIPPLAYLVEQIGGPHVNVDVLVQPGQDPHTFEPTPRQILALGRAGIFFKIDMPFENVLLAKIQEGNRQLRVVDTTEGIKKRSMDLACCEHPSDEHLARSEGDAEHHDHGAGEGEPDPHVWLSPPLLKIQAENIAGALCRADPAHEQDYRRNLAALVGRMDVVHRRVKQLLAPYRGRSFYVFHPGFGYFADTYGLRQEAVEAAGRTPAPQQLRRLIEKARAEGVTTIFVQPQFASQAVQVIASALGGRAVPLSGLDKNVIADIEDVAEKIASALKPTTGSHKACQANR